MLLTVALIAQLATATPAPPVTLSGGFGRPAVKAPARARLVITDASLPAPSRGTFSVSGATQPVADLPAPPEAPAAEPDLETSWRERVARVRSELAEAEKEYEAVSMANTVVTHGRAGWQHSMLMAVRNAALAPSQAKVMNARRELYSLPEECRRTAGCQPGWVR
jgi:hypothetical protein